mgnify:CR=1 FL=1
MYDASGEALPLLPFLRQLGTDVMEATGRDDVALSVEGDGDVRLEPKSLSFGSMCEEEFGRVYRAILNVIWGRVMQRKGFKSQEEVDAMVEKLLGYE